LSIRFSYDNVKFRLRKAGDIKIFLEKVIREQRRVPGDLYFIFTDDERLLAINRDFLGHNYFTDVISFDYSENKLLSGEVYISIDTVRNNAVKYKVSFVEEIIRVMIHGTLHICGYDDTTSEKKEIMFGVQERLIKEFFSYK